MPTTSRSIHNSTSLMAKKLTVFNIIHTKHEDIGISHRYLSCNFVRICITMMILVKGNSIMDTYFSNTGYRCMFAHVWITIIDN